MKSATGVTPSDPLPITVGSATVTVCAHSYSALSNCQRCGRVQCDKCAPPGIVLPHLGVSLPLALCSSCRAALSALDTAAAPPSPAGRAVALVALAAAPWRGAGETKTSAAKASIAAAAIVPAAALSATFGALKGVFAGALGGLLVGGAGGAALSFDAGNRIGGPSAAAPPTKVGAKAPPAAPGVAGGDGGGALGEGASGSSNSGVDLMARSKAILRLTPEERCADAEKEAARCAAAPTAYDVLLVPRDATPEAISRAYKALSMAYHPDRSSAPKAVDVMQAVNAAHLILGDAERRSAYDAGGCSKEAGEDPAAVAAAGPVIKMHATAVGRGASVAGGILGGLTGLGLGAASGALVGVLGGVASSIARAQAFSSYTLPASVTVASRVAAAAAVLATQPPGASLLATVDGDTGVLTVTLPPSALPATLRATAAALTTPEPVRLVDLPPIDDISFNPSSTHLSRIVACAGDDAQDRSFTLRLARALARVAATSRAELHMAEPPLTRGDGEDADTATRGDATGMGEGDTYEDVLARQQAKHAEKGPITSAAGMFAHMRGEMEEGASAAEARREVTTLLTLGAVQEAYSRGRMPTHEWLARRVMGLSGAGGGEEEGGKGSGSATAPLIDPDQGWGEGDGGRAWGTPPCAWVEVAVAMAGTGRAPVVHKGGAVAVEGSGGGGGVPSRDAAGFLWHRVGPATPAVEGGNVHFPLPQALLVHVQVGGANKRAPAAIRVRLVVAVEGAGAAIQVGDSVLVEGVPWERVAAGGRVSSF